MLKIILESTKNLQFISEETRQSFSKAYIVSALVAPVSRGIESFPTEQKYKTGNLWTSHTFLLTEIFIGGVGAVHDSITPSAHVHTAAVPAHKLRHRAQHLLCRIATKYQSHSNQVAVA